MTWRVLRKRAAALALAAAVAMSATLPAAAAEAIGDGVAPTYDEAYYATLDYYGNLLEGSMVKSYAMNGRDSLTDYGVYDEVVNLTDGTAPVNGEDGSTFFRFDGAPPDRFYFEGKTKQPFEDLPWRVALRYTLNGVPTKAEDLAGKQGVVEILLDIVPNKAASGYARYNYTLAATALFNQDDILSLEAPGAQVQLVGNLRTVLFLCLPGEEQHFAIRVGSNSFSFGGLTVLMVPATLAQLEEIAKLSERKDDLEEDYRALSGSLDNLLDALSDIQNGLYASAKGLDQLNAARRTFSGGKSALYDGTDKLRGDLSNLAGLLMPVEQRVQALSTAVTDSKALLNEMADATLDLQDQLADLEDALYGLERGTYDLKNVIDLASDLEDSLLRLERALGGTHISSGKVSTNSKALVEKVKNVHGAYSAKSQTDFFEKILVAQGTGSAEAKAKAKGMAALLAAEAAGYPVPADQQANLAAAKQLNGLHQAAKSGMHFQDFCGKLPGVTESQAKQMNDLWLIYSSGGDSSKRPSESTPPASGTPEHENDGGTGGPSGTAGSSGATGTPAAPDAADTPDTPENLEASGTGESSEDGGAGETGKARVPAEQRTMLTRPLLEQDVEEGLTARLVTNDPPANDGEEQTFDSSSAFDTNTAVVTSNGTGTESDSGLDTNSAAGSGTETPETSTGGSGAEAPGTGTGDSGSEAPGTGVGGSGSEAPGTGVGGSGSEAPGTGAGDSGSEAPGTGAGGSGSEAPGTGAGDSGAEAPGTGAGDSGAETPGDAAGQPPENDTVGGAVVDIITEGLDSASARIDAIQSELTDTLNSIKRPASAVTGGLADLCAELDVLAEDLNDAEDLMAALRMSSGTLRDILADVDALRTVLNGYEPTLQEALANVGTLSTSAAATIQDTEALIADAEALARDTGKDLDAGTKQSLNGLSAALRQTAKALAATDSVREAKKTITGIIEDTWDEYTGDVNNILMMDATAEPVSLTDGRNPAPSSIQVLIRTQEIKAEEPDGEEEAAAGKEKTTFWGRVAQMFRDFWNAVTGIFR